MDSIPHLPEAVPPAFRALVSPRPSAADKGSYMTYGTVAKVDETTLHISELPLRKWTQDYKDSVLEPMLNNGEKADLAKKARSLFQSLRPEACCFQRTCAAFYCPSLR